MPLSLSIRWAFDISSWEPHKEEWGYLLDLVEAKAREEVTFYRQDQDQRRALISRLAVRACVSKTLGLPWGAFHITRTRGKKPFLATSRPATGSNPNFNFSVSHEGNYVLLAAEPLCLCGVDVSAPPEARGRRQDLSAIRDSFRTQLTPTEWAVVEQAAQVSDDQGMSMFRCFWSLKEAFVKARGDGLGFELGRAEFTLHMHGTAGSARLTVDGRPDSRWAFYVQQLGAGHWAAVARGPPGDAVDALGDFKATFQEPSPLPSDLQAALEAPWPAFTLLKVSDLLPPEALQGYIQAGGEVL